MMKRIPSLLVFATVSISLVSISLVSISLVSISLVSGHAGAEADTNDAGGGESAGTGMDTLPEGPAVEAIHASSAGAIVLPIDGKDRFQVRFPAGSDRPAAVFSFQGMDINDRLGLALEIENPGELPVRVYADLNDDTWVRGSVAVAPGETGTLYVFARRKKHAANIAERFPGMHGVPGGKMSLWAGIEEPIIAKTLSVFMVLPPDEARIQVRNIRPFGSSKVPDLAGFLPFIDPYGQYKHKDWPGKVHTDAELKTARQREDADLAAHPGPADLNRFGGWSKGPQLKASGHFRVEKYEGKWWFVDPDGRLFWSSGLGMVGFIQSATRARGRERFFEDTPYWETVAAARDVGFQLYTIRSTQE